MDYVKKNWWKFLIIISFTIMLLIFGNVHEHWSDEAQSFLLARDNTFLELTYYMKYEGTPPLWVIIIKIFIALGGTYETYYLLPIIFSCIGITIFELKIKAPWYIKLLFPFTYFIFYQYSIVARSYCLVFPVLMLIICIYDKRLENGFLYSIILFLFMNISLHTLVISGSLYLLFLIDVYKDNKFMKKTNLIECCLIFFELLLTMICTIPNTDCLFNANIGKDLLYIFSEATMSSNFNLYVEIAILICLVGTFYVSCENIYSLIRFLLVITPVLMIYIFITYQPWHIGIIFFIILSYFIINNSINTQMIVKILFLSIFMVQICWSLSSIKYDLKNDYSASKKVAKFLMEEDYENKIIYGLGYSVTAIQPYFNKNIFVNQNTKKSFYFWRADNGYIDRENNINTDVDIYIISKLYANRYKELINWLDSNNYKRINFEGYTYIKDNIYESEGYIVYEK